MHVRADCMNVTTLMFRPSTVIIAYRADNLLDMTVKAFFTICKYTNERRMLDDTVRSFDRLASSHPGAGAAYTQ